MQPEQMFQKLELLILTSLVLVYMSMSGTIYYELPIFQNITGGTRTQEELLEEGWAWGGSDMSHVTIHVEFVLSDCSSPNNREGFDWTEIWCCLFSMMIYSVYQSVTSELFSSIFNVAIEETLSVLWVAKMESWLEVGPHFLFKSMSWYLDRKLESQARPQSESLWCWPLFLLPLCSI